MIVMDGSNSSTSVHTVYLMIVVEHSLWGVLGEVFLMYGKAGEKHLL